MLVDEKLKLLREEMKNKGIDAYIIPSSDAHQSEYVAEHWKSRAWISGFTGSAGTVVVTMEESGLWTDGRYFIQAEKQLEDSEIKLFKMKQPNVPTYIEWLQSRLPEGACVGFHSKVFSWAQVKELEKSFEQKEIRINGEFDLIDAIWKDRPDIPVSEVYIHDKKYAGKSVKEKLDLARVEMKKKGAECYLLSSLDDIAWLFNIRGNDVKNNPVVISYALVLREKAVLFVDDRKITEEVREVLISNGVEIRGYHEIEEVLKTLKKESAVFIDSNRVSYWLYKSIPHECKKIEDRDITTTLKSIKNKVEIENLRNCQIKDGAAMVKFLHWLDKNVEKEDITEISASERLEAFRREQDKFIGTSFDTIAGYKDHAAMMHYSATEETKYTLKAEGMFLVDSGGQYLDGTTDITRTIILGPISEEEKHDFTLVLKGHIALSQIKFLYGATGSNLDIIARQPLWEEGIDYKCGTGHGVGFLLNVHEGPQRISQDYNDTKLEKGMIITNEPGIYKEGKHGIRTENMLLVVEDEETEFGQFMRFEVISYCPIDLDGIDVDMLNSKEKAWLNEYHKKVYNLLSAYLNEEEREWLKIKTREI